MFGVTSCLLLSKVRKAYQNKLGSYQEIAYYYIQQRTIILVISLQVSISLLATSAYSFQYCVRFISAFIEIQTNQKGIGPWYQELIIASVIVLIIFPYSFM